MRYTGPKTRQCRREGVNLFGSAKYQKIMGRRPGMPGVHGAKRMGKMSDYAKQLREKQKAKRMFCLSEKQFRRYFDKATRAQEVTGQALFGLLERRLDNALYRAGFAMTRMQARQFASHGLFMLNGRRIDIPSVELKIGDKISIRPKSKGSAVFQKNLEELENHDAPNWLKVSRKSLEIEITALPDNESFELAVDPQMIVEFYSR